MVYSKRSLLAIAATLAATSSANGLELTSENFAEMTAGKSVFLKFYAPWCGHCKAMADDWARLEKDFEGHAVALVASVDCTNERNEQVCSDFNIEVGSDELFGRNKYIWNRFSPYLYLFFLLAFR